MKVYVVLIVVLLIGLTFAIEKSSNELNLEEVNYVLQNQRLLGNYIKCLLDERPCTDNRLRELKKILPELLKNGCPKCDSNKRMVAEKVLGHLQKERKKEWSKLLAKYDPRGEYQKRYNATKSA